MLPSLSRAVRFYFLFIKCVTILTNHNVRRKIHICTYIYVYICMYICKCQINYLSAICKCLNTFVLSFYHFCVLILFLSHIIFSSKNMKGIITVLQKYIRLKYEVHIKYIPKYISLTINVC